MGSSIENIRKKWVYHFVISPRTNIIEKPEWYLNQTLKWINEQIEDIDDKKEFIELPKKRLNKDMIWLKERLENETLPAKRIQYEILLVHTYSEVIQFAKSIRQFLGDLDDDLMSVFSDQYLFEKIIEAEWHCASRNFKEIIGSEDKWEPVLGEGFVDPYKIPRCVDSFLLLIKSLTERLLCFQQVDCQYKLMELRSSLFEGFLRFLSRSTQRSTLSRILKVLNGVNFLRMVLREQYITPKDMKLASDYKLTFEDLIRNVLEIYKDSRDHDGFMRFIKPKLAKNLFEIIHDDALHLSIE